MASSFFFYDLETSGFNPRSARIMQFAGQRTDMELNPIGEPFNFFIKLTADVLPEPDAVMLTGITPQQTVSDGHTEAEFLKIFYDQIVKPDTIFLGFNSVRFDDEFMRFLHYRNFYDAYQWQWKDGCSRWDILDLVRMTRALRPAGIEWPYSQDGKPVNRLELLTKANSIEHLGAHDALSDVNATIAVAKLLKDKQPDLFSYLLSMRDKRKVASLVDKDQPFIYTSSHFSSEFMHTTAVVRISPSSTKDAALVYDLRIDPTPFLKMNESQLINAWQYSQDSKAIRLPVKTLKFNRAAAVAPLGVIKDAETQKNIKLDLEQVEANLKLLRGHQSEFALKLLNATKQMDEDRNKDQADIQTDRYNVDDRLYYGFVSKSDGRLMEEIRRASPDELDSYPNKLEDVRLKLILALYKARNFPKSLTDEERSSWEDFCLNRLTSGGSDARLAQYFSRLQELARENVNKQSQYLIEELMLYGQSLLPQAETQ
jgi:exodeoxyribonuclease-1